MFVLPGKCLIRGTQLPVGKEGSTSSASKKVSKGNNQQCQNDAIDGYKNLVVSIRVSRIIHIRITACIVWCTQVGGKE